MENYFELFGVPESFLPDGAVVKKAYMRLSRQYHPDYFVNSDGAEQENALEMSALLNKGLKTLSNKEATMQYVLKLRGVLEDEEKFVLPQDFLMEMMDVNEAVEEAGTQSAKQEMEQKLSEIEKELYADVKEIVERGDTDGVSEEALLQVKEYYFKKKYLRRLSDQLAGKL